MLLMLAGGVSLALAAATPDADASEWIEAAAILASVLIVASRPCSWSPPAPRPPIVPPLQATAAAPVCGVAGRGAAEDCHGVCVLGCVVPCAARR